MAKAMKALGWVVVEIDTAIGGKKHDLSDPAVVAHWISEIRHLWANAGVIAGFLAPPCSSFSQFLFLCAWFSRTYANPWGDGVHPKEILGNKCVRGAWPLQSASTSCAFHGLGNSPAGACNGPSRS